MSISPITYGNFQTARQIWVGDGGPWKGTFDPMDSRVVPFISSSADYCDGSCLVILIAARGDPVPIYQLTASANISVDMTQYENVTSLDFTWTFWPGYDLVNSPAGTSVPIHTQINDVGFDDSVFVIANDFYTNPDRIWPGNLISRTGTMSVTPVSGRSFISIVLSLSTLPTNTTFVGLLIKNVSFKITTPIATTSSSSSRTSSASTSSPSSRTASSSQFTLPPIMSGNASVLPSESSTISQPSSTALEPKISTAAIGGLASGAVALVALLISGLLFYRNRKNKTASSDSLAHTHESNTYLMDKYPPTGSQGMTPSSGSLGVPYQIPVVTSPLTASYSTTTVASLTVPPARSTYSTYGTGTSTMRHEPPPMYDNADSYVSGDDDETADPSTLAVFASSHRELISEDLEARLEAAGYLPAVDPNRVTEEEWLSLHNVTKLEVMRLQRLYQMERQRADWQHAKGPSGGTG